MVKAQEPDKAHLCLDPSVDVKITESQEIIVIKGKSAFRLAPASANLIYAFELLLEPVNSASISFIQTLLGIDLKRILRQLEQKGFLLRLDETEIAVTSFSRRHFRKIVDSSETSPLIARKKLLRTEKNRTIDIGELLENRRSHTGQPSGNASIEYVMEVLGSAHGGIVTQKSFPSAGGLYPLTIYAHFQVGSKVETYNFLATEGSLVGITTADLMLNRLFNDQETASGASAALSIHYTAVKNAKKYGTRGLDFALLEAGHFAQNVLLRASQLGMGTRCFGSFSIPLLRDVCQTNRSHVPIYTMALF